MHVCMLALGKLKKARTGSTAHVKNLQIDTRAWKQILFLKTEEVGYVYSFAIEREEYHYLDYT